MDEYMKVEISLEDRYFIMLALNGRIKEYEELCRSAAYKAQSKEDFERVKTLRYFKNSYIRAYRAFEHAVHKVGDRKVVYIPKTEQIGEQGTIGRNADGE